MKGKTMSTATKTNPTTVLKAQAGDPNACGQLVHDMDGMVSWMLNLVSWRGDREDGMQEGRMGVLEALQRFDPKRGIQFHSYAFWYIRKALERAMQNTPIYVDEIHRTDDGPSPVDAAMYAEIREIMDSLPEDERVLIFDRFYYGKTLEEMGNDRGGMHRYSISIRIKKVLEKIKEQL